VILASSPVQRFGVEPERARLRFGEGPKEDGVWAGRRLMWLGDKPAFELSFWCGTCPLLFERLAGANDTLSLTELQERLAEGLDDIDAAVLTIFADLLPVARYLPMLLRLTPRLVMPSTDADYFAREQVETWGINGFWGLPEYPRTPYYRTFETAVAADAHLYEFIVPMVPPSWNDRDRVERFASQLAESDRPTAIAISVLDVAAPATDQTPDYYEHWALMHFVLDGHHKLEAAATAALPLRLLSLVSVDASLATESEVLRLPELRAKPASVRAGEPRARRSPAHP
jgi:hypothetical protein